MPTTYNGIGTHYYGRKNPSARNGVCGSCHRPGVLVSYDTRLWFVVVFIPVIPLGRKRVIDECPSCRRHLVANADAYEEAKQLQISAALEQFRREPSPVAAMGVHASLLGFHEHDQAAEFRRSALDRYPDHAALRAGFAGHLTQVANYEEANRLFEEAMGIEPDLPEARVGVARQRMAVGKLDDARVLLDFLEQPGAGRLHSLNPLDVLSTYMQKAGRHEEALEISEHLLREIPEAGRQHTFRAFVKKSEKALGLFDSILPPQERTLGGLFRSEGSPYSPGVRRGFFVAVALVLLTAGLLISNEYIRGHRAIRVVNACNAAVQVKVDGGPPQSFPPGLGTLSVAEGHHKIEVAGAATEDLDVDLRSGYLARWTHKPLWVLNPGSEAAMVETLITYSANPEAAVQTPHVGRPFVEVAHVDYPFEAPPAKIQVKGRNKRVKKTAFAWVQGQDDEAFLAILNQNKGAALTFAGRRLRRNPDDVELLKAYLRNAADDDKGVLALLRTGLDRRPVAVMWHRAYQTFAGRGGHEGDVISEYDRYLAAAPDDAALLYLRGRVEPDDARQLDFYRRSLAINPRFSWPWLAMGVHAANRASWAEALDDFRKAKEQGVDAETIDDHIHVARLAVGEAGAMANEYRARARAPQHDLSVALYLGDALAAAGKAAEVLPALTEWLNRLPGPESAALRDPIRSLAAYQAGDAAEAEKICQGSPSLKSSAFHLQALAALGRAAEAAGDPEFEKAWKDPKACLAVALELAAAGKADEAASWRGRAIQVMDTLSADERTMAKSLAADAPTPVEDIARLVLDPGEKALAFATLASRFPDRRAEYLAQAARYNIRRVPPYLAVKRAIGPEPAAAATP